MFKKLLVVVLALTFLVSLCSMALATKDPNQFKRGTHVTGGNPNAGRVNLGAQPAYPPVSPAATPTKHFIPNPQPLQRPVSTCDVYSQYGTPTYYFDGDSTTGTETGPMPFGSAVRWTAGAEACTLKSIRLGFYAAATLAPNAGGINAMVWSDNGSGLPGAVISTNFVPHASILNFPTLTVALTNVVLTPGDYHTGFMPVNPADEYALIMDDASGPGNNTSSLYWLGAWSGNGGVFGLDLNWVIENEICCEEAPPNGCSTQEWHCTTAWRWPLFTKVAERFTATDECTLKTASLLISNFGTGAFNAGINARVYANNGGLPGAVLATIFVPHASVVYSPTPTVVDFSSLNLVFINEDYFVGYESVNPAQVYQGLTDDGGTFTCPDAGILRGVAWDGTQWDYMYNLDEYPVGSGNFFDDNWMFDVYTCCAPYVPNPCNNLNYAGTPYYYWPEPDVYGDQFRNQRFTNVEYCSLKTVNLAFDNGGTIGAPGAQVNIWNSDGTYPTSVITSYLVNPVTDFFPSFTSIDVTAANLILAGDYHVGYTTIQNNLTDVLAILSDDGSSGSGRSVEYYLGQWWLMANSWGVDVDFLINVDRCCLPEGYCPVTCSPTDDWPTFAHDYGRTSQSELYLGDLCGVVAAWRHVAPTPSDFSSPVISNDLVLCSFFDRIQAVNLLTGTLVWDTKLLGYGAALSNMRSRITIDGNAFYFGLGNAGTGFAKGDLATGNPIWIRSTAAGNPLPGVPGVNVYSGSIVRGNEVYFGDGNGQIYALDATTGATLYSAQLLTPNSLKAAITGAPTTDGSQLFFATGANLANATTGIGGIHSVTPGGSFTSNWTFYSPNIPTLHEGYASAPSLRCDNLFIHSYFARTIAGYVGYAGYRQNLDPATGVPNWAQYFLTGQNAFSGAIATTGNMAFFHQHNNGYSGPSGTRGIRAVSFANSTVWASPNGVTGTRDNNVWGNVAVTCDPYIVYGTWSGNTGEGHLVIGDANTGSTLIDYNLDLNDALASIVNGVAVASGSDGLAYIVVSVQNDNLNETANGVLHTFKVGGPRPRLSIPETLVMLPGTNDAEASPVQRTDMDAVENVGCATLNVTATLEAGIPPAARRSISTVHPSLAKKAETLAAAMIDYSIDNVFGNSELANIDKGMNVFVPPMDEEGNVIGPAHSSRTIKSAKANSSALAPPSWVDWIVPFSGGASAVFAVAGGGSQAFTFEFDRSGMNFLAPNIFYVEIDSDDPDYNLLDPLASPQGVIEYQIPYEYCPVDTGRMEFGTTGGEWYSNRGELGDGNVAFDFTLSGTDDAMYEGTMYFMTSMDDAAWNPFGSTVPVDFGFLYPFYVGPFANADCGGCDLGVTLPVEYTTNNGVSYANTVGDLCTFAMIDSLQGAGLWPNQAGPEIGLLISYREVGTYGADFGDFKLIVVDLLNRNASPINGLYYGSYDDWDIGATDAGYGDALKGYAYQSSGTQIRGFIGVPLSGSYWPDGSKTDPMYNARIFDNTAEVYDGEILDSLFYWMDAIPEDAAGYSPGTGADKSMAASFGKVDLAGNGSASYGFAIYGFDASANFNGDSEALSKFVNKYAGFARGDVNNDDIIDLRDLVRLSRYVNIPGSPGPAPFKHLGDVNNDGVVDGADCSYLAAYYFTGGAPPKSAFKF